MGCINSTAGVLHSKKDYSQHQQQSSLIALDDSLHGDGYSNLGDSVGGFITTASGEIIAKPSSSSSSHPVVVESYKPGDSSTATAKTD